MAGQTKSDLTFCHSKLNGIRHFVSRRHGSKRLGSRVMALNPLFDTKIIGDERVERLACLKTFATKRQCVELINSWMHYILFTST